MNKIIITLFAVTLPFMVFAQLKVDTNGHVGIGTTATSFNSPFSVGSSGESGVTSTYGTGYCNEDNWWNDFFFIVLRFSNH